MNLTPEQKAELIKKGFKLLTISKGYSQSEVVAKLKRLQFQTSTPVFNRLIKNDDFSSSSLIKIFEGMKVLIKKELCFAIGENRDWIKLENCKTETVSLENENDQSQKGFVFHQEGRLEVAQKVDFFSTAKSEIIEFGITLNMFTIYLMNKNPKEFRNPLLELLKKGVQIKCYLLDPEWNGTRQYFEDRKTVLKEDVNGIEKIRTSLRRFKIFNSEISTKDYRKNLEIYTYRHFPSNYFLAIDKDAKSIPKMMVSNYLFGEKRAYCPVIEFTRQDQPILFHRYKDSLEKIIKGAKKVNLQNIPD